MNYNQCRLCTESFRDTLFEAIENLNRAAQAVSQIPAPKGGAK